MVIMTSIFQGMAIFVSHCHTLPSLFTTFASFDINDFSLTCHSVSLFTEICWCICRESIWLRCFALLNQGRFQRYTWYIYNIKNLFPYQRFRFSCLSSKVTTVHCLVVISVLLGDGEVGNKQSVLSGYNSTLCGCYFNVAGWGGWWVVGGWWSATTTEQLALQAERVFASMGRRYSQV